MSWLFSQALVEEYSPQNSAATEPYAQLNVMPTPQQFWRNDKMMESSRLSRFGLTLRLLTEPAGEELLMRFLGGFPAKTSALPDQAQESKASDLDSGSKWSGSLVRFDRGTSEWRTLHCLWVEVLPWSSVTLPRWGLMRDGVVYRLENSALLTNEIAPGWLGETFPTPSVAMVKGSSEKALTRVDGRSRLRNRLDYWVERDGQSGRLNPEFVEWVMGWPIGWTDVAPLETGKYREWQQQHGKSFQLRKIAA